MVVSPVFNPPNLQDQVPVFMSTSDRVAQLLPQALGALFIASYDSQGYGVGILTNLEMGNDYRTVN
jgi:hypothetical protein